MRESWLQLKSELRGQCEISECAQRTRSTNIAVAFLSFSCCTTKSVILKPTHGFVISERNRSKGWSSHDRKESYKKLQTSEELEYCGH